MVQHWANIVFYLHHHNILKILEAKSNSKIGNMWVPVVKYKFKWATGLFVKVPLPFTPEFGVRFPVSAVWKKQKCFFPIHIQYCGEPPWPRGSVLGLRPPGLEFRIVCLEDSVISFISPSSGEDVHKGDLKPDSFNFICHSVETREARRSMWDRHSVKRSDGTGYPFWMTTLWKRCFMRPPPHTSLY